MTKRFSSPAPQQASGFVPFVTYSQQQQQPNQAAADPPADPPAGDPPADPPADPPLGEAGEKALRAEREARKALEREMKLLKQQLSPEARQAAEDRLRAAEETAIKAQEEADKKAATIRSKYEQQLQQTAAELESAMREFVQYRIKSEAMRVFQGSEGMEGISNDGSTSYFDMWFSMKGSAFKFDENGALIVVDSDGEQLRDPETRLPVSPVDWVKQQHTDPVLGSLFKPAFGSGSGSRGSRDGRAVPGQKLDLRTTPKGELFQAAFGRR
jgi:hypothetical protein